MPRSCKANQMTTKVQSMHSQHQKRENYQWSPSQALIGQGALSKPWPTSKASLHHSSSASLVPTKTSQSLFRFGWIMPNAAIMSPWPNSALKTCVTHWHTQMESAREKSVPQCFLVDADRPGSSPALWTFPKAEMIASLSQLHQISRNFSKMADFGLLQLEEKAFGLEMKTCRLMKNLGTFIANRNVARSFSNLHENSQFHEKFGRFREISRDLREFSEKREISRDFANLRKTSKVLSN